MNGSKEGGIVEAAFLKPLLQPHKSKSLKFIPLFIERLHHWLSAMIIFAKCHQV